MPKTITMAEFLLGAATVLWLAGWLICYAIAKTVQRAIHFLNERFG